MNIQSLTHPEQEAYFAEFILKYLQEHGGQAHKDDIREDALGHYEIAQFYEATKDRRKPNGTPWPMSQFDYKFRNGSMALLSCGFIDKERGIWSLTEKGTKIDFEKFDAMRDVINPWNRKEK